MAADRSATLIALAAVVAVTATVVAQHGPIAGIAGAVVALLPGPSVAIAVLGHPPRSRVIEYVCWSIGFGFASAVICGVFLNAVAAVTRDGWALSFASVALVSAAVRAVQTHAAVPQDKRRQRITCGRGGGFASRYVHWGALGIGVCTIVAAVAVSVFSAEAVRTPAFSQLWILPAPTASHPDVIHVGVRSRENVTEALRVLLYVNGTRGRAWSITLDPGQTWRASVREPISADVAVRLFRREQATAYRYVTLSSADRTKSAGIVENHANG